MFSTSCSHSCMTLGITVGKMMFLTCWSSLLYILYNLFCFHSSPKEKKTMQCYFIIFLPYTLSAVHFIFLMLLFQHFELNLNITWLKLSSFLNFLDCPYFLSNKPSHFLFTSFFLRAELYITCYFIFLLFFFFASQALRADIFL